MLLGVPSEEVKEVVHLVLASSSAARWGDREQLEGVQIICREVVVCPAAEPRLHSSRIADQELKRAVKKTRFANCVERTRVSLRSTQMARLWKDLPLSRRYCRPHTKQFRDNIY
jgi:hypothetical protein